MLYLKRLRCRTVSINPIETWCINRNKLMMDCASLLGDELINFIRNLVEENDSGIKSVRSSKRLSARDGGISVSGAISGVCNTIGAVLSWLNDVIPPPKGDNDWGKTFNENPYFWGFLPCKLVLVGGEIVCVTIPDGISTVINGMKYKFQQQQQQNPSKKDDSNNSGLSYDNLIREIMEQALGDGAFEKYQNLDISLDSFVSAYSEFCKSIIQITKSYTENNISYSGNLNILKLRDLVTSNPFVNETRTKCNNLLLEIQKAANDITSVSISDMLRLGDQVLNAQINIDKDPKAYGFNKLYDNIWGISGKKKDELDY